MAQGVVAAQGEKKALRLDIEGLRAIAVGLVVAYHATWPFVPGGFVGVDVFFVISGFLITAMLVREAERTGRVSLPRFYARRARRLLPASAVVLVLSALGTWWWYDGSEARDFGGDISWASVFVANWRFAARSVDYLAEDTGESPVLHFWSLGIEEQFYFIWPLLVLLAALIARRLKLHVPTTMAIGLALIAIPSFWASVSMGDAPDAFFSTWTRLWELAIGAAVAIAIPVLKRMSRPVAEILAALGITGIIATGLLFTTTMAWPGWLAAVPVLATAAVIAAGTGHQTWIARVLGNRLFVFIGGFSYSIYLWHWPFIVFPQQALGELSTTQLSLFAAASLIPAYLSYRFIENPVRFSKALSASPGYALTLGAALALAGLAAGLAVTTSKTTTTADSSAIELDGLGAQAPAPAVSTSPQPSLIPVDQIIPLPADAPDDAPSGYAEGCQVTTTTIQPRPCIYGDPSSSLRIVAIGDSKLFQYSDALDIAGQQHGWRIEVLAKSACAWHGGTQESYGEAYAECSEYNERVTAFLADDPPDMVLVGGGTFKLVDEPVSTEAMTGALVTTWQQVEAMGSTLVVLVNNPAPVGIDVVFECVSDHPTDYQSACAFSRAEGVAHSSGPAQVAAANAVGDVSIVGVTDLICPTDQCTPVVGGVLVLRQGSHITNTYALTMADELGERIAQAMTAPGTIVGETFVGE